MSLPQATDLLKLFGAYLNEAGLSAISNKNYLSDLRHFLAFATHTTSPISNPSVEYIFENLSNYINLYRENQVSNLTPVSSLNRRLASVRRFSAFLKASFNVFEKSVDQTASPLTNTVSSEPSNTSYSFAPTPEEDFLRKLLNEFKLFLEREKKSYSTVKNYLSDVNHFLTWSANDSLLTADKLPAFFSEQQLSAYNTYEKLSQTSTSVIIRRLSSIKKLAQFAFDKKYLSHNPFNKDSFIEPKSPLNWIKRLLTRSHEHDIISDTTSKGEVSGLKFLYSRYASLSFAPFLNLVFLVLAISALSVFGYDQIMRNVFPSSAANPPVVPNRMLSFQGRLTDVGGTPITTAVNVTFRLFDAVTSGTQLYTTGTCSISPNQDGIFNTNLGNGTCGSAIPATVFANNRDVFVEIQVASETLSPRQQIATVGYALNSDTLQGFPASVSATAYTVPVMDGNGNINLASFAPSIIATGSFTLKGSALTLQTTSAGNIVIQPDTTGNVQMLTAGTTGNQFRMQNANVTTGNLISGYIGNDTSTGHLLSLSSGASEVERFSVGARGDTIINTNGGTDSIFSASASGSTKFVITGAGNVGIGTTNPGYLLDVVKSGTSVTGAIRIMGGTSASSSNQGQIIIGNITGGGSTYQHTLTSKYLAPNYVLEINTNSSSEPILLNSNGGKVGIGSTNPGQVLDVVGNATVSGNLMAGGQVQVGRFGSAPATIGAGAMYYDAGSNKLYYSNGASWVDMTGGGGSGTNFWQYLAGTISPAAISNDVLLGGTATSSAKIGFLNMNGSAVATASISGTTANITTFIDGNGNISTTRRADLTLGNSATYNSTGNVLLNSNGVGYVGIGTTNPTANLYIKGAATGNIFTINDGTNDLLTVSSSQTTINNPTVFNSSGDVSFAYNLNFTNPSNSYINSAAPLYIAAGETYNSSNLTLRTYNKGNVVVDSEALNVLNAATVSGQLTANKNFQVAGAATVSGNLTSTNSQVNGYATTSGSIAVGYTNALAGPGSAIFSGNVGIGLTNPAYKLDVAGTLNLSTGNTYKIAGTDVLSATTLGTTVVTSSLTTVGALASGSIATGFGTITTANTITGTTLNGTTGLNTGAAAGTQRIDASGNLVNINNASIAGYATTAGSLAVGYTNAPAGPGQLTVLNRVGIGKTNPTVALDVVGAITNTTTITAGTSVTATTTLTAGTTATYDPITISPVVKGANAFTGSITSADLTAARTWTFPDKDGTVAMISDIIAGTNYWQLNGQQLAPGNTTLDLMIGGTSTASAKFYAQALTGNVYTAGNATVSGNLTAGGQIQVGRFGSAPANAGNGSMYYDSGTNKLYYYNGSTWVDMTGGAGSTAFSAITTGTNTSAAMTVGAGASLNYTSTGTINASTLIGGTWAAPGTIGSTTPNTAAFTSLTSTGLQVNGYATASGSLAIGYTNAPAGPGSAIFSGNVGIGTTNPLQKLDVAGAIRIGTTTSTGSGTLRWNGSNLEVYNATNYWEVLSTGNISKDPTGFPNRTDTSLSFNSGTTTFTITGTNFKIYIGGQEFTKNTENLVITSPVAGTEYFIYYDASGNLTYSTIPWSIQTTVQVATLYWTGTEGLIGDERHGLSMDGQTHEYLHNTVGARYSSGLAGTFSSPPTFSVTSGAYYDEDIKHTVGSTQTTNRVMYHSGTPFITTAPQTSYFHEVSNVIQYDNAGTLTPVTNNNYVAYWIFATNDPTTPIYSVMGQRIDSSLANARANATFESLDLNNFPFKEQKLLYRVILQRNGTTEVYIETQDYRSVSNLPAGTYTPTSHSTLTGLSNDDHLQYALLAGRTGGQTLYGGIAANESLILNGSSIAGGGNLLLNTNGGNVGIGTTSPLARLDVRAGTGTISVASISGVTSFASLVVDNSGLGDIFTASTSGQTRFVIDKNGNVGIGKTNPSVTLDVVGAILSSSTITGTTLNGTTGINTGAAAGTQRIDASGNLVNINNASIAGYATTAASIAVGYTNALAGAGNGIFSGKVGVGLTNPTYTLDVVGSINASTSLCINGDCKTTWPSGINLWQYNAGAIIPAVTNSDLLLGGTSTASAKIALINVNEGYPTASIAGNLVIGSPTGTNPSAFINILNGGSLSLGTSTADQTLVTSALYLKNDGSIGLGTNNPQAKLDISNGDLRVGGYATVSSSLAVGYTSTPDGFGHAVFSGNVGVGILNPGQRLDVSGSLRVTGNLLRSASGGNIGSTTAQWNTLYLSSSVSNGSQEVISIANQSLENGLWYVGKGLSGEIRLDPTYNSGGYTGQIIVGSGGTGKLDVGTVDPPYTINGERYATYLPAMIGVKEEVTGNLTTSDYVEGVGYRTVIDLLTQPKDSDLWVFSKTTALSKSVDSLTVLLTAQGPAKTWYELDTTRKILTVYSSAPSTISYRLTAPRFDADKWATKTPNSQVSGFIINDPDINSNGVILPNYSANITKISADTYTLSTNGQNNLEEGSFFRLLVANFKAGMATISDIVTDTLIVNDRLISPVAQIDNLQSDTITTDTLTTNDATVSGILFANNLRSATVDTLSGKLNLLDDKYSTASAILSELQAKYGSYESLLKATTSSDLLSIESTLVPSASIPAELTLSTIHASTIMSDDVLIHGSLIANSLNSYDQDLYIQPDGERTINLLAGLMVLHPTGQVVINGDLLITGTLYANAIDTKNATVSGQLALGINTATISADKLLAVYGNNGSLISSVDASGSADFRQLATNELVIASNLTNLDSTNSATIGTSAIATNSSEIFVPNLKVDDNTLVYITPVSDTQNQVLFVKSQKTAEGFTVGVTTPVAKEIKFNYWLVKTK